MAGENFGRPIGEKVTLRQGFSGALGPQHLGRQVRQTDPHGRFVPDPRAQALVVRKAVYQSELNRTLSTKESGGPAAASGPSEPGYPQNKRFRCALTHSLRFTGLIETEQVSKLLESRLRCRDLRIPGARDSQALAWFLSFACSCLIHRR
jgi:hypothetical protein